MKTIKNKLQYIILIVFLCSSLLYGQEGNYNEYVLQDDVVMINEFTNSYLQTSLLEKLNGENNILSEKTTLNFQQKTSQLEGLQVGSVMACANGGKNAPNGYIGRIEEIKESNGSVSYELRPVALNEIFQSVHYRYHYDMAEENQSDEKLDLNCPFITIPGANLPANLQLGGKIKVCGSFDFNLDIEHGFSMGLFSGIDFNPSLRMTIEPSLTLTLTPQLTMEIEDAVDLQLGEFPLGALPPIGPIVLIPKFQPFINISSVYKVTGKKLTLTAGPKLDITIDSEFGYDSENGGLIMNFDPGKNLTWINWPDPSTEGSAKLSIGARFILTPNGYSGILIGAGGEYNATLNIDCQDKRVQMGFGIPVSVKASLKVKDLSGLIGFSIPSAVPDSVEEWGVTFLNETWYPWRNCNIWSFVDCAPPAPPPTCNNNGQMDNGEFGVDCGGPYCNPCQYDYGGSSWGGTSGGNSGGNTSGAGSSAGNNATTGPSCSAYSNFSAYQNGSTISFTELANSNTTNYLWNFGDGGISVSANPTNNFQPGTYSVCLLALSSTCDDMDLKCKNYTIAGNNPAPPPPPPPPPNICTVGAGWQGTGLNWSWNFTATHMQNVYSYEWHFGDGQISYSQNPSHTYANNGTYWVYLRVYGCGISVATTPVAITIDVGSCQPTHWVDYPLNKNITYDAKEWIAGSSTVNAGKSVNFNAGNTVYLQEGFWAKSGSNFRAYNQGCWSNKPELNDDLMTQNPELTVYGAVESAVGEFTDRELTTASGVADINWDESVAVYPNPFTDIIKIGFLQADLPAGRLSLFDVSGRLVQSESFEAGSQLISWNTHDLFEGIYLLKIELGDQVITKKLVK